MKTLALNIIVIFNIASIFAETDIFKHDITVGSKKIICTFTMVFEGPTVNLRESKAICSKVKKTTPIRALKIMSESSGSGNIYIVTMLIKRGTTKAKLQKVVLKLAVPPEHLFACLIAVGDNDCSGTLQVENKNHTLKVDIDASSLANCQPNKSGLEVVVYSNSKYFQNLEFILDVDATVYPNKILYAFVSRKDGALLCPLIGFDIVCQGFNPPGTVIPGSALCDNDCFLGPASWEECASQCLGVTGGNTSETMNRGSYYGWSYQSHRSAGGFGGNCCCKNIKNGVFQGNIDQSIFGDAKCLGSGANSP